MAEALADRIDRVVDQLLAREDASSALRDPELAPLAPIAGALRLFPSPVFKARLRAALERSITMASVLEPTKVREGFTTVTPFLRAPDDGLFQFLVKTFGAVETMSHPGRAGGVHREVRVGDSMLMIGEGGPADPEKRPQAFHAFIEDVDAAFDRAIAAGGVSLGAVEDRPYGERSGFVEDPYGNYWYLARQIGPTPIPAGYHTVTPYLHPRGTPAYIDFLKNAFSAVEEFRASSPDGVVRHAQLRIGNSVVELGEHQSEGMPRSAVLYLYVGDADALYAQAVAAGARPLSPPADQWYGDRVGSVEDAMGVTWYIAKPA